MTIAAPLVTIEGITGFRYSTRLYIDIYTRNADHLKAELVARAVAPCDRIAAVAMSAPNTYVTVLDVLGFRYPT